MAGAGVGVLMFSLYVAISCIFLNFQFLTTHTQIPYRMNNSYLLTLSAFLLSSSMVVSAQTFLNGSFENTTGSCSYGLSNASFSSMMSDCNAFGSASQIDILDNTCGFGTAENGTHFVGIAVDITNALTDAFAMELSAPMVAGNTYMLTFYGRKDPGYGANLLEIGYSSDSTMFGTAIDTAAVPTLSWGFVSMTFTPTINCSHITVRTIAGTYGWNFVDDFAIADITNTNYVANDQTIQVYPNPTAGNISIVTPSACVTETVTVKDIQGNTLLVAQSQLVDLTGFAAGVYILEVETNSGRFVKRIVKE